MTILYLEILKNDQQFVDEEAVNKGKKKESRKGHFSVNYLAVIDLCRKPELAGFDGGIPCHY